MRRQRVGEWMDDPTLPASLHQQALRGLRRINRLSGVASRLWPVVRRLLLDAGHAGRRPAVLDVACGGGDVMLRLMRRARREGIAADWHAMDISGEALGQLRRGASAAGCGEGVTVHRRDVLREGCGRADGERWDIAMCTLFLHHLDEPDAEALLRGLEQNCRSLVISDLRRSRTAAAATWAAVRVLSTSPVVHVDASRSVRAAWTPDELRAMAGRAGLDGAVVRRVWPWRMQLTWSSPNGGVGDG